MQFIHADCTITGFKSDQAAAVSMGGNTSAAFHHTSMVGNTIEVGPPKDTPYAISPTSIATGKPHPLGSAILAGPNTRLLMHDCIIAHNSVFASESAAAASPVSAAEVEVGFGQLQEDYPDQDVDSVSVHNSTKVWASPARQVFDPTSQDLYRHALPWNEEDGFTVSRGDFEQFSAVRYQNHSNFSNKKNFSCVESFEFVRVTNCIRFIAANTLTSVNSNILRVFAGNGEYGSFQCSSGNSRDTTTCGIKWERQCN